MGSKPKYILVKQAILKKIQSGELRPQDKLPSEAEYATMYSVSNITVRKALAELVADGYVHRVKGKGSFVSVPSPVESSSKLVALILSAEDYHDASYMKIIKGAQPMLSEFDYSLIVEWSDEGLEAEREIIQKMLAQGVAGFLIYPFDPVQSKSNYALIEQGNIPYVLIDRYNPDHPTYFVGCNNCSGAIEATKELLRLKHTKIKFASYHFFLSSEQERFDGYCSAMRQAGLPVTSDNLLSTIDYDSLAQSINRHDTTAIFCCNDKLALKLIRGLMERGIRVPQDVSVMGFDDWDDMQRSAIGLSTVKQNFELVGGHAANLLVNAMQGKFEDHSTRVLTGVELIVRESVCENPYAEEQPMPPASK